MDNQFDGMTIASMASKYFETKDELDMLGMDIFGDEREIDKKKKELFDLRNKLFLYDEYEQVYTKSDELNLNKELLYPFTLQLDENNNEVYVCKDSQQYQQDVQQYLDDLQQALSNNEIDKKTYLELKKDTIDLANEQMEKIKKEEQEKEQEIDVKKEYQSIMNGIKETRDRVVYNQIGEMSYGILKNKYKNMTELSRKETLIKTNEAICNELGIECEMKFTKYDLDTSESVSKEGYYILTKDVKGNQYPLEVILFEQISKVYTKEMLNNKEYPPRVKEQLNALISKNIDAQKQMILNQYKKKELDIYNS